ncbi:flagellar protein FliT [Stutzerimonas degradans]|uniref:flagellar protein FliT n=1 Tax=Stutzerimonas degradans TaxID=2968968 RepID=UPI0028D0868A|nr:flagellar protein FliT [Stutzerimonas degradans]
MSTSARRFEELGRALREALACQDWDAITELDTQVSALLGEVAADEAEADQVLRQQLDDLVRLYAQLQQDSRAERERLALELTRLSQSKQVANAYKPLD